MSYTPAQLIAQYQKVKQLREAVEERHAKELEWYKTSMAALTNALLTMANEQGVNSFSCEDGTAYKSEILNMQVTDEHALLDFAEENWETFGSSLIKVSAIKEPLQNWLESAEGKLWLMQNPATGNDAASWRPGAPGVNISYFTKMNVRKK